MAEVPDPTGAGSGLAAGADPEHWDDIYRQRDADRLGWYEAEPATLARVRAVAAPDEAIIDVGAGASQLVDHLLAAGYRDITLLDLSNDGLEVTRDRLARRAESDLDGGLVAPLSGVHYIVGDVVGFRPERRFALWHDRAVFHFLVDAEARSGYREALRAGLEPGGHLVIATFSLDGPDFCAGLPVLGYDVAGLAAEFADLELIDAAEFTGSAEAGDARPYVLATFRRPR